MDHHQYRKLSDILWMKACLKFFLDSSEIHYKCFSALFKKCLFNASRSLQSYDFCLFWSLLRQYHGTLPPIHSLHNNNDFLSFRFFFPLLRFIVRNSVWQTFHKLRFCQQTEIDMESVFLLLLYFFHHPALREALTAVSRFVLKKQNLTWCQTLKRSW